MKWKELRSILLEQGANGRTLLELKEKRSLETFRVPEERTDALGSVFVKVNEGILEIPYRMIDIEGQLEEFVIGAERLVDKSRVSAVLDYQRQQTNLFKSFTANGLQTIRTKDYKALADALFIKYQEERVHYKAVGKRMESEVSCKSLPEEIFDAVEGYIRYNLSDQSLTDTDIDYYKEVLATKYVS